MVKDAEVNAESDKKLRDLTESRNRADAAMHTARKSLTEHAKKLEASEKAEIEDAISKLEAALKGDDKAEIDARMAILSTVSQKLGEKMYVDTQAKQPAGGAESSPPPDDVIDADFKEVSSK